MPTSLVLLIAFVQGVTEFLPVSSSGHLVLVWQGAELMGVPVDFDDPYSRRSIDVAAHVGTLFAVLLFYRTEMLSVLMGFVRSLRGDWQSASAQKFWLLVLASVPLVLAGALWSVVMDGGLDRQLWVVGTASIVFGLVIWWFDARMPATLEEKDLTWRRALVFGLFQVLALIPGTSRSGITMAAGRALGFSRQAGTKLALLLSVPAIAAAGSLQTGKLVVMAPKQAPDGLWQTTSLVAVMCAVTAYMTLSLFTRFLPTTGFLPYVIYRVVLGGAVLTVAFALQGGVGLY